MNEVSPQEWVKALESKQFRKARGQLKKKTSYCCLGVLTEIRGCTWGDDYNKQHVQPDSGLLDQFVLPSWMDHEDQEILASKNDKTPGWDEAIKYIKEHLYPRVPA